ncbi:beta-lactamase family protein [Kitasatospora sp. NA04385]|uniref:serine hydrolase domain-containing protein n=1 Tax=Kitasatospora sp. NA04385 TaxID=2742135 RepID=UPI001590D06B|nr:serine hydrolase domain-containing protein [Kitasatospora sp. NA04385]QKW23457.1 beta-lactamase family protein [Kitasatospora sp. NA04385]
MSVPRALLPRSAPAAAGVSSRAVGALLDRLAAPSVECHSLMVVHRGQVVAEGWWAPYSAERPQLLYSLTKSFTSVAVGLAVADGLLSPEDRVVDVLPEHVPADASEQARRLTVHHLLTMTTGHPADGLTEAWEREPDDLVRGFLGLPFTVPEGTRHVYDNATTFLLARMVERVTGRGLPEFLDERLFGPMGVDHAEWDRVGSGAAFGFHGLHLTTEAVAAFGELLLRGGRRGDRQLVPRAWVELATRRHVASESFISGAKDADFSCGYGYQFWMSRHGYHGNGAFGQQCVVLPSHDLVVAVTAQGDSQPVFDALWECLLPGIGRPDGPADDAALAARLRGLSLPPVPGTAGPGRPVRAVLDASPEGSALPDGTAVSVDPADGGWVVRLGPLPEVPVGHGTWRESAPLGRPVLAVGAWQDGGFVADLYLATTPHRVRLTVDATAATATAVWSTVPLTGPRLELHLRSPLMTRPDVA